MVAITWAAEDWCSEFVYQEERNVPDAWKLVLRSSDVKSVFYCWNACPPQCISQTSVLWSWDSSRWRVFCARSAYNSSALNLRSCLLRLLWDVFFCLLWGFYGSFHMYIASNLICWQCTRLIDRLEPQCWTARFSWFWRSSTNALLSCRRSLRAGAFLSISVLSNSLLTACVSKNLSIAEFMYNIVLIVDHKQSGTFM